MNMVNFFHRGHHPRFWDSFTTFETPFNHFWNEQIKMRPANQEDLSRTELKLFNAKCSWEGNTDFRQAFQGFLNRVEQYEQERLNNREILSPVLQEVAKARAFVEEAGSRFNEVRSLNADVQTHIHQLRLNEQTPEIQSQIMLLSELQADVKRLLDLPQALTEDSARDYASIAQHFLQEYSHRYMAIKENKPPEQIRSDVENTHKQATEILIESAKDQKLLDTLEKANQLLEDLMGDLEKALDEFEGFPPVFNKAYKLIKDASYLRKQEPRGPAIEKGSVEAYLISSEVFCKEGRLNLSELRQEAQKLRIAQNHAKQPEVVEIAREPIVETPVIIVETPTVIAEEPVLAPTEPEQPSAPQQVEKNDIAFLRDEAITLVSQGLNTSESLQKELCSQDPLILKLFSDLFALRSHFWTYQTTKCHQADTKEALQQIIQEIEKQKNVDQRLSQVILEAIVNAKNSVGPIKGNIGQAKKLIESLTQKARAYDSANAEIPKEMPLEIQIEIEAIHAFLLSDSINNRNFLERLEKKKNLFQEKGFADIAEHFDVIIDQFKEISKQALYKGKDQAYILDATSLDRYVAAWNEKLAEFDEEYDLCDQVLSSEEKLSQCVKTLEDKLKVLENLQKFLAYHKLETFLLGAPDPKVKMHSSQDAKAFITNVEAFVKKAKAMQNL